MADKKFAEKFREDYRTLYIHTIKPAIDREDSTRPYASSSPSNGVLSPKENWIGANPASPLAGDVHYYTMGNVWNWTKYPSGKFVSEYGFQSWSSLHTLEKVIGEEHFKYPLMESFVHREHSNGWLKGFESMIKQYIPHASHGGVKQLEDYIYTTQVFQAMSLKVETEFYRRNRAVKDDGTGYTMGALYWQLNDIWPTVSWASLEFGGKWKMAHYFAAKFFENTLIQAWEEAGELRVAVVRDDHEGDRKQQVEIAVYNWSSLKPIHQQTVDVLSKPFNVTVAFHQNVDQFLKESNCTDRHHCFVQVTLTEASQIKSRNFHFLSWPKDAVGLEKATILVKSVSGPVIVKGENVFAIELETNSVAPFVWIDFVRNNSTTGRFSDNGFLMSQKTVSVNFFTEHSLTSEQVKNFLTIKSLKDVQ